MKKEWQYVDNCGSQVIDTHGFVVLPLTFVHVWKFPKKKVLRKQSLG